MIIAQDSTAQEPCRLLLGMANRHGLITGASGTGKTITLQTLAENFSRNGVPVFLSDAKGDLSGIMEPAIIGKGLQSRIDKMGLSDYNPQGYPVNLFDVFRNNGHGITTTIENIGAMLLARVLELNSTQTGVLNTVFRVCRESNILIYTIEDLRTALKLCYHNSDEISINYGNVSKASIGAIQRSALMLEDNGGNAFISDSVSNILESFIRIDDNTGYGYINILDSVELLKRPILYSVFMIWMLDQFYNNLPEQGDADKPKIVLFFDEAHLMFTDASKTMIRKIEQTVRLIRSKGVGLYFISQSPSDIPDSILAQLSNRIQHGLRAYTTRDRKALKSAADSLPMGIGYDAMEAIQSLGIGEALVSCLDSKGSPTMARKALVMPPTSRIGPASVETLEQLARERERIYTMRHGSKRDGNKYRENTYSIFDRISNIIGLFGF